MMISEIVRDDFVENIDEYVNKIKRADNFITNLWMYGMVSVYIDVHGDNPLKAHIVNEDMWKELVEKTNCEIEADEEYEEEFVEESIVYGDIKFFHLERKEDYDG